MPFHYMRTEMDIYVKKAIIHQFGPSDTDLLLADKYLNITPKIEEYLRKKIERVYSDEAKTGIFTEDNVFLSHITKDLLENVWYIHHLTFISQQLLHQQQVDSRHQHIL